MTDTICHFTNIGDMQQTSLLLAEEVIILFAELIEIFSFSVESINTEES